MFGAIPGMVSTTESARFHTSLNSLAPSHRRSLCSRAIREEVKQKTCGRRCFKNLLCCIIFANAVDALTTIQTCKRANVTESLLLLKSRTIYNHQTTRRYIISAVVFFSRLAESDLFVQSVSNDVLASKIRREH